ncbi:MAG: ATPase, T2SS/T4P/T4SS family, partial [Planctomycetaceae bacterium]|nr:ATPase, T2SS/T4P/T4SS family [Planctomycetaceae bacterium]
SDVHLIPEENRMLMQWRIDGVLHTVAGFGPEYIPRLAARLKVLSGLLTYRTDAPQEGRITSTSGQAGEVRVTTFPTLFGEKVALRLFAVGTQYPSVASLGFPVDVATALQRAVRQTSGVLMLCGPSGSGKTTTAYACLREIIAEFGQSRSVMTLEDPIEVVVSGATQSQVNPAVDFDLAVGLKSMMRQDPDVILVGEIRDPQTAIGAFQAALTGHLVITTFHAGSNVEAVTRLLELGIEPYLIRSTLRASVCQRLLRRSCADCPSAGGSSADLPNSAKSPDNTETTAALDDQCPTCGGLGYHGRFVTAELLDPDLPQVGRAIADELDAHQLQQVLNSVGTPSLFQRADQMVDCGETTAEEVFRVLGTQRG